MTSNRLKWVYGHIRWRDVRQEVLHRAEYRCEAVETELLMSMGERCAVTHDLTIDHQDPYGPDPFDANKCKCLCRRHHGKKDGGRRADAK